MTDATDETPDYWDGVRDALLVLNPHVYYDPRGKYGQLASFGHWVTVELAVRSWGWDETEKIPEVRALLYRLSALLDEGNDES